MHGSAYDPSTVARQQSSSPPRCEVEVLLIAESRLRNSQYAALRHVWCEYRDGVLVLYGRLPSHYLKQVAQSLVQDVDGILGVLNQIEVLAKSAGKRHYEAVYA